MNRWWVLTLALVCTGCGASASARGTGPSVSTVNATQSSVERGKASYYADSLAGRATASGEPYNPREFTAAHRTLPFGTMVKVSRADGRQVVVRINDRGPFQKKRVIDLSKAAAQEIGMIRDGVVDVAVEVISVPPPKPR